jgi:hypothetical protein
LTRPDATIEPLQVDLGTFSSDERLARHVFKNAKVIAWMAGSTTLCLTLDSLDEAHNRIENLYQMLAN